MISIAINGACGRLGRAVAVEVRAADGMKLVACVDAPGNPDIGKDIGRLLGSPAVGLPILDKYTGGADVLIDFSTPAAAGE